MNFECDEQAAGWYYEENNEDEVIDPAHSTTMQVETLSLFYKQMELLVEAQNLLEISQCWEWGATKEQDPKKGMLFFPSSTSLF